MAESINFGEDRSALALQYENLRKAVANRGEAENAREARDIERKGLFGTGIKSSDLQEFGNIAITGAELGDARMGKKMDRAEKSFGRRQASDERRIASLKERAKGTGGQVYKDLMGEIQGLEMGMGERRNSFEDYMGKYQEKGVFGTKFGGDDVGYRTEGESKYSIAQKAKALEKINAEKEEKDILNKYREANKGFNPPPMRDFEERAPSQPSTPWDYESEGIMNRGLRMNRRW